MHTETAGTALKDRIRSVESRSIPLVSVVAPVYCEERVVGEFYGRCKQALEALTPAIRHEVVFVNDGSTDGSLAALLDIAGRDPAVRVIDLSRNFGHQLAITAGIDHAAGDAVVVLDADLQDPPEVIGEMVRLWREGNQVVYGVRRARRGESAFKRLSAGAFYRILSRLSDVRVPLDSGDFRLMDRAVVDVLKELREESRYLRGLVSWVGFRQCPLPYDRDPRFAGKTKFGLSRMFVFALDGISSFSDKPLRVASHLGMLVTVGSLLAMVWVIAGKLIDPTRSIAGWTSVMVVVLFLGGVQLLSIGLLGEYVGRIFRQAKARPLYVVARRVNFTHRLEASERNTNNLSSTNESTAHGGAASTPAR
jgi:glycosyltransferase involved in cell wall biosynthesis